MENRASVLKSSIEKLQGMFSQLKLQVGNAEIWTHSSLGMATMKKDLLEWELARERREFAAIERIDRLEEKLDKILDYIGQSVAVNSSVVEIEGRLPDDFKEEVRKYMQDGELPKWFDSNFGRG